MRVCQIVLNTTGQDEVCNNFAIAEEPTNITCPLLFGSCLEEGGWVLWRLYLPFLNGEMLELYYTSLSNISAPNLNRLNDQNLYVSEDHKLVIKYVDTVLHSNITCAVMNSTSNFSAVSSEANLNMQIVELRKLYL